MSLIPNSGRPRIWATHGSIHSVPAVVAETSLNVRDAIQRRGKPVVRATHRRHFANREKTQTLLLGPYIFVRVIDTGTGTDAETIRKMFDPFFTTKTRGIGLGLLIALGVARLTNGAITVESEVGNERYSRLCCPGRPKKEQIFNAALKALLANRRTQMLSLMENHLVLPKMVGGRDTRGRGQVVVDIANSAACAGCGVGASETSLCGERGLECIVAVHRTGDGAAGFFNMLGRLSFETLCDDHTLARSVRAVGRQSVVKIFVTRASCLLGSAVVRELVGAGYSVITVVGRWKYPLSGTAYVLELNLENVVDMGGAWKRKEFDAMLQSEAAASSAAVFAVLERSEQFDFVLLARVPELCSRCVGVARFVRTAWVAAMLLDGGAS